MKTMTRAQTYFARRSRRYPNEASPAYFAGRLLDGITALITTMGVVTLLLYFMTF